MTKTVVIKIKETHTRIVARRVPRCSFTVTRGGRQFQCTRERHENATGGHVVYTEKSGYHFVE